jgi:hypothetical protein
MIEQTNHRKEAATSTNNANIRRFVWMKNEMNSSTSNNRYRITLIFLLCVTIPAVYETVRHTKGRIIVDAQRKLSSRVAVNHQHTTISTPYYVPRLQILSNDDNTPPNYEPQIQQYLQTSRHWPSGSRSSSGSTSGSSVSRQRSLTASSPRVIHIVKTRLMQEQATLQQLNTARLLLFHTFTLPTMAQQTQQNFVWFIKVDPALHNTRLLHELVLYIQEAMLYNNTYIIGSNRNFRINEHFPGAVRDGAEIFDMMNCKIYSGNQERLELLMSLYEAPIPILETRLDADDGLHIELLDTIQRTALQTFEQYPTVQWMYYCCRRHMEWHWMDPLHPISILSTSKSMASVIASSQSHHNFNHNNQSVLQTMIQRYGTLQGVKHTNLCITPGITTAYNSHTREAVVPVFAHDELVKKIKLTSSTSSGSASSTITNHTHHHHHHSTKESDKSHRTSTNENTTESSTSINTKIDCGYTNGSSYNCLQFIETFLFEAIRSRTPTSAGMLQITADHIYDSAYVHYMFWNMLHSSFGIVRSHLRYVQQYISDNLIPISQDNFLGQCTTGHSCKESAKKELQQLILSRQQQKEIHDP